MTHNAPGLTNLTTQVRNSKDSRCKEQKQPAVTAVSPTSGLLAGGTSVTITGSGFTGSTAVNFGSTPASSFRVDSGTQITAASPASTSVGPVHVTVTTQAGTSARGEADQFRYSGFNLEMTTDRQSAPYPGLDSYSNDLERHAPLNTTANAYPVGMTRHHIIPFNVLVGFWNMLLEREAMAAGQSSTIARQLLQAIANNVDKYGISMDRGDKATVKELSEGILNNSIRHDGASQFRHNGLDSFATVYQWLPGNLFIGPANRADDPKDQFEQGASVIVGNKFSTYKDAYNQMQAYIQNTEAPPPQQAVENLRSIAQQVNNRPFPLDPGNWEREKGAFRLKNQ